VDSLVAVEVRNWIFKELKADVSVLEILSPNPISALTLKVAAKSELVREDIRGTAPPEVTAEAPKAANSEEQARIEYETALKSMETKNYDDAVEEAERRKEAESAE
jgi:hypothetical protein